MVKKEIIKLLESGEKIIAIVGGWGKDRYYIGEWSANRQLTPTQFELYAKMCNNSDTSAHNAIRGQAVKHYFWF